MDDKHFNKLFWFCAACVFVGISYLMLLTFIPIPKGSERFADNSQGFFQGSIITAAIAFLLGGNIPTNKKPDVNVTGDKPTVNTAPTQPTQE